MAEEKVVAEQGMDEKAAKKTKKRTKKAAEDNTIVSGLIDRDTFVQAVNEIQNDAMITVDQVEKILLDAMTQAYLDWSYPGLFNKDSDDSAKDLVKAKVEVTPDLSSFQIYDIKTVMDEDDITDDSYQVSLEDAKEVKKDAKLGDVVELPFDMKNLNKAYIRRVKQLFQAKLKEASRNSILALYSNQIGGLIKGTVTRVDTGAGAFSTFRPQAANKGEKPVSYELSFGKASGFLRGRNLNPSDHFNVGDVVTVYLSDVSDKMNPPSLVISRTSEQFILALMKASIPEIQNGTVKVRALAREAGRRTKVFVESMNANVDPIGACVGPESTRMKTLTNELHGEKIDVLVYHQNKALQVIESMKPAEITGLNCPDDFFDSNVHYDELEREKEYEYPPVTVVVANGQQGIAIGTSGANVRLASKITMTKINVQTADDAIKAGLKYLMVPQVQELVKKEEEEEAKKNAPIATEAAAPIEEEAKPVESGEAVEESKPEAAPAAAENAVEAAKPAEAAEPLEEKKAEAAPAEEAKPVVEAKPAEEMKEEPKKEEKVEHVEIYNKPKVSLADLEEAISSKKGPAETRSYKRRFYHDQPEQEAEAPKTGTTPTAASKAKALPIYTKEELEAMQEENGVDANGNPTGDYYDEKDEELDEDYSDIENNK